MSIYETIIEAYPELIGNDRVFYTEIIIQDDSDGEGVYLAKWDYSKAIPEGLKLGK